MTARGSFHRGFTLVELMVSMTVGMMVLVAAVTMLGSTGDGYERLGGGVSAEREARALLGRLTADLGSGTFHEDMLLEAGNERWPLDRIGFLSLQPGDAQLEENRIGDLCAVRYYLKDEVIGGKTVRCLMRGFVESGETFRELKKGDVATLFKEPAGTGGNTDEAIAFGVVAFEARPKIREVDGKLSDWKKSGGTPPDALALRLVVARRELMGKLNNPNDWNGKGSIANLMGEPSLADRNGNFQVYETVARFGYHEPK